MATPVELTWEQKVFVVRAFATLNSVAGIMNTLHRVYGVRCNDADVIYQLDPNYRTLPPDLHQVFLQTQKQFEENPSSLVPLLDPIKQQVAIANCAQDELTRGAPDKAAKHLEQLAKLQGGFFSGKAAKATDDPKGEMDNEVRTITRTIIDPVAPMSEPEQVATDADA